MTELYVAETDEMYFDMDNNLDPGEVLNKDILFDGE